MSTSPHRELIAALTDLYTTLHSLAAIPEDSLRLPDAETGVHPLKSINSEAAREAGYDEDAISLMYALPYLDVEVHDTEVQLLPSTFITTYLGPDLDAGNFESQREMLYDELMPSTAIRLTWSETGIGYVFIYDTKTSEFPARCAPPEKEHPYLKKNLRLLTNAFDAELITPWKPCDNPDEVNDYSHAPADTPLNVLGPIIEKYRSLHYLGTPAGIDHNHAIFSESDGQPPSDWDEAGCRRWKALYDVWVAVRKLKEIYLECGWDVDASEQIRFRRDEFLERRRVHWEEVVEPLERIEETME